MKDLVIGITAASYSGNKGAAAMLQSSISQLHDRYGEDLNIHLMSVYPGSDRQQCPWDFVKVVSCKPQQLLFIAFPLACLYRILKWCPPLKALLLKNRILKAYHETDLVIDEAGISFVDSRGFIMNTYAFVCAAVPLLMGVPVVKYAQAMGTFHSGWNRFLARWILPKISLICARGKVTQANLAQIGVTKNVKLCADGAFTMPDDPAVHEAVHKRMHSDPFWAEQGDEGVIGVSLSSVVEKKCVSMNIPYQACMTQFIDRLTESGCRVMIIANAARLGSTKTRNNDLMICDAVYRQVKDSSRVCWYHEEMGAEEIREYIACCRYLVASRFHAMIGALEKEVPVLLIGWSHKYQEVLDYFELGQYAIDYSRLSPDGLWEAFETMKRDEPHIRGQLKAHHDEVMDSSLDNIRSISQVIDQVREKEQKMRLLRYDTPQKYTGEYLCLRRGYATDEAIRANAASGGMVTALLCDMLANHTIDGAWVCRTQIEDGHLSYRSFIATTREELMDASSSVYMYMPLLTHVQQLRDFQGKLAVVLVPCQMRSFTSLLEREPALKEKVVLKVGLFCSGSPEPSETLLALEKNHISLENATRLYYRRGHWRGVSAVIYKDGTEKHFSYAKSFCAYKNAYFFYRKSCMLCQDQFGYEADISFGDIWLKSMRKEPIKNTCCVIRSQKAKELFERAQADGAICARHVSGKDMVRGQKRALVFKFNAAAAKKKDYKGKLDTTDPCRFNHRLAYSLASRNRKESMQHPQRVAKIPQKLLYYYMCFIRALLSF